MKIQILIISAFLFLSLSCLRNTSNLEQKEIINEDPYELVNPFIGTGGHGHTFPGATLPFGMVQLSPDTRLSGWDGVSGYHYTDSLIYGFSHTHLSGTGVGDYGDILLMPGQGEINFGNGADGQSGYRSPFKKNSEIARPGYYRVLLDKDSIQVRLTSTERVGIHEYEFGRSGKSHIVLDLDHRDFLLDAEIKRLNDSTIIGKRISKAWAKEQHCYFALRMNTNFILELKDHKAALGFNTESGDKVLVKVGISSVDIEGALKNLLEEAPHNSFEKYKTKARSVWSKALNKISVKGRDSNRLTIFYTALYHSMIAPNKFNDIDGRYRGMDQEIHEIQADAKGVYTVFSLWDTFRATHPLYTLIERERTLDFIRTFLRQYQHGGRLPVWELACNETDCMIGYHSVSVIADAYAKGIRDFDQELALEAMLHSANLNHFGLESYKRRGYIAADDESESVSKTLEYAYDDWAIAQYAKALGRNEVADSFYRRAQSYKNIFNPELGFMQPKMNGRWNPSFDPTEVNFNFTEANSWQYSFFVPHDVKGLISLHGGEKNFEMKLDELFETSSELKGRHQSDITGLIGQYAHGNEPSHHMAYLYNFIAKPWKTQKRVSEIMNTQYSNSPEGLSGNEDCGQMSSWYVLSSMGLYAVNPGSKDFIIGTPHFDQIEMQLENGKTFQIETNNLSDANVYIQSIQLNDEIYTRSYISTEEILEGGKMIFQMGPEPQKTFFNSHPLTQIVEELSILPSPYFKYAGMTFSDSLKIEIGSTKDSAAIFYSINKGEILTYDAPFIINKTSEIRSFIKSDNRQSAEELAEFRKVEGGRSIELLSEYSNQYNAGGDQALIDYLEGSRNFRTGFWQGYQGQDVGAIVDLGNIERISLIKIGALQDIQSWIWLPKTVEISISKDKLSWTSVDLINAPLPADQYGAHKKIYTAKANSNARYVKIHATYPGNCPDWHLGSGGKAWIFMDEISVE